MALNKINDAQVELNTSGFTDGLFDSFVDTLYKALQIIDDLKFIEESFGSMSAGRAIKLNSQGKIDSSMIDVNAFHYVGPFTPQTGNEYPDTTGEDQGAFWSVEGLAADFTFTEGSLTGQTTSNGDFMIWTGENTWGLFKSDMNPSLYYKLDGSQSLTAPLAAGGNQLKMVAEGTESNDAVTKSQLDLKADINHTHDGADLVLQNDIVANMTVGGVNAGDTFLAGDPLENVLRAILVKYKEPYIKENAAVSASRSGISSIEEVGINVTGSLTTTIKDGLIKNQNGAPDTMLKGGHDAPVYSGDGIDSSTGTISMAVKAGDNVHQSTVHFLEGTDPYYDSNGNEASNLDSYRLAENKSGSSLFRGVYPQFYGMSTDNYHNDTSSLYTTLNKNVIETITGDKQYSINGNDAFIYFVLPTGYKITRILDGNNFDVTSNFIGKTMSLFTPYYAHNFYIMKSIALTSVDPSQTYKITIATD